MTTLELTFPRIDPVAIAIGPVRIHWYAIMYLLAFAMAYGLMRLRLRQQPFASITTPSAWVPTDVEDLLLHGIVGVILGGRLGYVLFYQPGYYWAHPLDVFKVWDGGMSFHGGAIGVILAMVVFAQWRGRPFLQVADFLVPAVPIGLAAGRIGNFINGELWGRQAPVDLPWAMRFPTGGDVPRHPSQLYQALLEGVLLFVLLWLYARTPRLRGQVAAAFLFGYGILRFVAEYWREPDSQLGFLSLGLSMGQWLSVPMILAGAALWLWARRRGISDMQESSDNIPEEEAVEKQPATTPAEETAAGDVGDGEEKSTEAVEEPSKPVDEMGETIPGEDETPSQN